MRSTLHTERTDHTEPAEKPGTGISDDTQEYAIEPERYELTESQRYRFELERREFLRVLGGGLVVVAAVPSVFAQESGRGTQARGDTPGLAAWLHIDDRGRVTAYTGKTEIGQNIRTSLAQAIAEELRIPLSAISMVMADTDLTPYDAGTFGSQSTPRMGRQLARAAATAREMLIDQAAGLWGVDRTTLTARDGRILSSGGKSAAYGELTKGQKLTGAVAAEPAVTPAPDWSVRGQPAAKVDGRAFVTGRHQYTPDVVRPGLVYGSVLRPATIGATLSSIDDERARAIAGVSVVRDGDFVGVVAQTERAARRAAAAIQARWTPASAQPSSETIYDHLRKVPDGARTPVPFATGDVAAATASRTFQASYRIPYIAHVPLEPRAAVAEWSDGKLTVWTGTQRPFGVRTELAEAFRIPEGRVRVIVPDTGSAYGGKHSGESAIEAARLAKAAGRPVKLVWTRAEEFSWAYFRPAGVIDVKAAVNAEGQVVAWEFDNWNSGNAGIRTPYDVPNQRIAFHPSRSPLRQGSYRGLAATANHYAREMHMDEIARALGADAVEFRLRHLRDDRMRAVLSAAARASGWPRPSSAGRALGIACGTEKGSYVATAAELSRAPGGFKVERIVVAFECGAIVNPDGLRHQVEGAVVQGLGGALFEAIEFDNGRILNGTMAQYRVPRFKDIPPIEVTLIDRKDLASAGAGETPIVCVAPAIGSAARAFGKVAAALPVRISSP
jgi:CO/xanthine dehydrogenase Mo-binding subunit